MQIYQRLTKKSVPQKKMSKIAIAIIGAGSIGMLFFHLLKSSKCIQPFFVDPRYPKRPAFLRSLRLIDNTTRYNIANFAMLPMLKEAKAVIITTKSYSTAQVCQKIKNYLPQNIPLIISCNGIGTIEEVKKVLGATMPTFMAITTHGAMKRGNICFHRGIGTTFIGPLNSQSPTSMALSLIIHKNILSNIAKSLNGTVVNNILPYMLKKLCANAVINPLTAIYQCSNGELLKKHSEQIFDLTQELTPIFKMLGLDIKEQSLLQTVKNVCEATSCNHSSMAEDIRLKRPTEIDYILKPLLKCAKQHALKTDFCQTIYTNIKKIEQNY